MADSLRLFIAVDLPDDLSREIDGCRKEIKGVKWVNAQQIHLTLNFLGDIPSDLFTRLKQDLAEIKFAPIKLKTAACGFFPNAKRPAVFFLGIEDCRELFKLKEDLDRKLEGLSIKCETRKFIPHLTLARIKFRLPKSNIDDLLASAQNFAGRTFTVNSFFLFSSKLDNSGAVHTKELEIKSR